MLTSNALGGGCKTWPLIVSEAQLQRFVDGVSETVDLMHSSGRFWTEALGMAGRVIGAI